MSLEFIIRLEKIPPTTNIPSRNITRVMQSHNPILDPYFNIILTTKRAKVREKEKLKQEPFRVI